MAKQKMMAKVHYNNEEDSFELWIRSNSSEEWGVLLFLQVPCA